MSDNIENSLEEKKIEGLGGWLILVCLGLFFSIIKGIFAIYDFKPYFSLEVWKYLSDPSSEGYHFLYRYALIFDLTSNIVLVIFIATLLVLFFRKRSNFPKLIIVLYITCIVVTIVDTFLWSIISGSFSLAMGSGSVLSTFLVIIEYLIWTMYFLKSKRVKNTFIK